MSSDKPPHNQDTDISQLLEEKERLEKFLEHVGGGLGLLSSDCRIIWTNDETEKHFGIQRPAIGMHCREVLDPSPEQCRQCPIPKAFAAGQPQSVVMETWLLPDESSFYQFTATPILSPDGTVSQVMLLAQDVTKRCRTERELKKRTHMLELQNRKVVEVTKQKSRFFASMSHELRSPLTSIIGFTEILLEDVEDPLTPRQRELLKKVSDNSQRLLEMINDLLDLSKIESGKMTVTPSRVDLDSLVTQVVETMMPLVRDKDLTISAEVPEDLPVMRTDEQKLSQVLVNLLSNAVKFTPRGDVRVNAELVGGKIKITVSDTGIGIRRADFVKIFQEFRQVDGNGHKNGGTGLGLAITRKMVHLLGGNIKLSSKLGKGSTFTVTLPVLLSPALLARRTRAVADA
jgi:PAS domain S-box-containing protein